MIEAVSQFETVLAKSATGDVVPVLARLLLQVSKRNGVGSIDLENDAAGRSKPAVPKSERKPGERVRQSVRPSPYPWLRAKRRKQRRHRAACLSGLSATG
jgi:hypothetical protein